MKTAVALVLVLASTVCTAAPTFLMCAGTFYNHQGRELPITRTSVAVDQESKILNFQGHEYAIALITDQTIAAGPTVKTTQLSMYAINVDRVTGAMSVVRQAGADARPVFQGDCRVTERKF